jgi:ribose 5-phosphate isomerase A
MTDGTGCVWQGNMVVDVRFPEGVKDPADLENKINMIPGVIENGLFIKVAHKVLVGTKDGDETSVVEFSEFVASMKSSEGVSA